MAYEITNEPLEEDFAAYGLTEQQHAEVQRVSLELHERNPALAVSRLEKLVEELPRYPQVWNHLAVAYQAAHRTEDGDRIIEETYRRFPYYLFAVVNYAHLRIRKGHPEEVPAILNGTFALHQWLPGRTVYHISEAVNFFGLLAIYFMEMEELELAAKFLDMLERLQPDHQITQTARSRMMLSLSELMFGDSD